MFSIEDTLINTRLYKITQLDSYFVVRAKKNLRFKIETYVPVNEMTDLLSDQIGVLKGVNAYKTYPVKLRKVAFYDKEMNRTFIYLTNNMELHPEQIALLYKNRWQIELIFKWIKQHLKIKSFWETSENAVRIQIYSAIIAYCLIAVIEHDLQINRKTYEILQILGISLLNKTPIIELFTNIDTNDVKELNYNQLSINFI
jgi:hypothetical protein